MQTLCQRLKPQTELFASIDALLQDKQVKAGVIISMVGSLTSATLRFAGADDGTVLPGPLEIVSATGVVAQGGSHIHLALSDSTGKTIGGHLMPGSLVYTTVELVILDISSEWQFTREYCELSGFDELVVKHS